MSKGISFRQKNKKNISIIKEIVYENSPISRIDIANIISLTPAAVTKNVSLLIEEGLIHEIKSIDSNEENSVGRKPIMLEFIPDAKYVIGIELSRRGMYVIISNLIGETLYKKKMKLLNTDYDLILNDIVALIEEGIKTLNISRNKIAGIGVGIPGYIDRNSGYIKSGVWSKWENKKIGMDLSDKTGFEVCIDNNASVRAVAEVMFKKNTPDTFAYLFVSRGIACPLMIKRSVLSSEITGAGEIGHMTVDINGERCDLCGDRGCLDVYSSEIAIEKKCAEAMKKNNNMILKSIANNPDSPTIDEILEAVMKDDEIVLDVIDVAIEFLAASISNIIKFVSPQMVIVDSRIMKIHKIREKFLFYIENHLKENKWKKVEFIFKTYNEFDGAIGSAAYAIKNFIIER